ncbi:MAG: ImmA/IrrE family metallo-endopeptidase [Bacteroidota bacterium]|nr:ImmA/IrrE family metallo-endopeptidase [Bacteroidota bacterium]
MKKNSLLWIEIGEKASTFRSENGYGPTDPILLNSLLLKKNIITLFKPLTEKFSGMAIKASEDLHFILINQNHTLGKQHFTIGHEIYHLFVQENFISQRCNTGLFDQQKDNEEKKADFFAACLLMPENGIIQLIPNAERQKKNLISDETLFRIQQYYGLSVNAVIYRLCELKYIDSSYFDKYNSGKILLAKKLGFDDKLYKPGNFNKVIGDYGSLVNRLYQNKKISESYYLELLNAINIDPFSPAENDCE